ncbi:hypothetical protein OHB14_51800 [Streptomyces sp. NBC_01613]|uniref:hypothetical protein n=1 Tax=Streptomyces sp. NBC_01613 TaxID=2975896 RepID=UPI00386611AF
MRSIEHRGARPVLAVLMDERLTLCRRARTGTAQPSARAAWGTSLTVSACIADASRRFAAGYLAMADAAVRAIIVGAAEFVRFAVCRVMA